MYADSKYMCMLTHMKGQKQEDLFCQQRKYSASKTQTIKIIDAKLYYPSIICQVLVT